MLQSQHRHLLAATSQVEEPLYLIEVGCHLPQVRSILADLQGSGVALTCIVVGAHHNVI